MLSAKFSHFKSLGKKVARQLVINTQSANFSIEMSAVNKELNKCMKVFLSDYYRGEAINRKGRQPPLL